MKKIILMMLLIFTSLMIVNATDVITGTVKGTVLDETKKPMEYASVAIYNLTDSTLVTGGLTNKDGIFEIKGVNKGEYYIIANFIGYKKYTINNIKIEKSNQIQDLGTFVLNILSNELQGVEIVADRQRIEYKIDKKIINVGQDINAVGGTAVDVLENTPSVEVDIDGNVALRGSSSFIVLIDGKPSVLTGSDALRQIPATTIQNIEIITNPSAKYDPDGSAGIINIVMKKNIISGFNGIANLMAGTGDKYRGDLTLNYKTKKSNLLFGADWNEDNSWGKMYSERQTLLGDTISYIVSDGKRTMGRSGFNVKGGADLYLSDNTTLTISGSAGKYGFDMGGNTNLTEYTFPLSDNIYNLNTSSSSRQGDMFSTNVSLQKKFNKDGTHKLDIVAYYSNRGGNDIENQDEYLTNFSFDLQSIVNQIRTTSNGNDNNFRLKLDYVKPLGAGKLETGLQTILERETEDYTFENFDIQSDSWVNNSLFSSNMNSKNDVYSAYVTYSNKLGKFQYMGGLRGEYTDRYIYNLKSDKPAIIQRFDLFPSAHISYDISKSTQLMSSYSRRIRRPDGRDLDPFASYIDQYTIRVGNPNLKPEYTNSYELQLMQRMNIGFISLDAFYRATNDLMTRVQDLQDGIIYMTTDNVNNDYSLGTEVMGNLNFTKWFNLNTSLSVYDYKIKGELNGVSIDRGSTNYSVRANANFKIGKTSRVQFMSMFRGPSVSAQGSMSSMFFSNLSYKQDLLKNKLTATLSIRDVFGTMKMNSTSYGTNFNFINKMSREPRVFQLTLSYNINNYKVNNRSTDIENNGGGTEIEY